MSMSIESSMGWRHALMWERSRTELNDYYSKEQPRRTESHQGKDAGSPRTYIAPWRSRESSSSPVSARVLRCTRPSRSLSRASALQPHSLLPRPPPPPGAPRAPTEHAHLYPGPTPPQPLLPVRRRAISPLQAFHVFSRSGARALRQKSAQPTQQNGDGNVELC